MKGKFRLALLASALAAITIGTSASAVAVSGDDTEKGHYLSGKQTSETIAARQRFFGIDNVNPRTGAVRTDRVIMSWMGIGTFAASFNGHVIFMDTALAYAKNGTWGNSSRYLGFDWTDYAALNPELALVGHGHADHMGQIVQILGVLPNLRMYGMEEHCNDIRARMAPTVVNCTSILPAGAQFGSEAVLPDNLIPGVDIRAVKHPHSAAPLDKVNDPPFSTEQAVVHDCLAYTDYPPTGDEPVMFGGPTSGVLSFFWQFHIQGTNFSLGWSDTTGDESGDRPVPGLGTGAEVPPVVATWPHTNVYFGSIAVSPRRIFLQQAASVEPQIFIPVHHDPCADDVKIELDNEIDMLPNALKPRLWFISDPGDYGRPITFDPSSPAWD
jgi:hypothetical protein